MSLSEFCVKSMRIGLCTSRNTHAQTFPMSRLVNLLILAPDLGGTRIPGPGPPTKGVPPPCSCA